MQHEYNQRNAEALCSVFEERIRGLAVLIEGSTNGNTLEKMLEDGKFPPTQSKALRDAFEALRDAFDDVKMQLVMPFEIAHNDLAAALLRAKALGCTL